jgi:hypothetical protein
MAALCAYIQAAILVRRHAEQKRLIEKCRRLNNKPGMGFAAARRRGLGGGRRDGLNSVAPAILKTRLRVCWH